MLDKIGTVVWSKTAQAGINHGNTDMKAAEKQAYVLAQNVGSTCTNSLISTEVERTSMSMCEAVSILRVLSKIIKQL